MEKMKKHRKQLTTETMEAKRAYIPLQSNGVKAKQMTGRDYKSRFVKVALASGKSVKHTNVQGEEERLHSASKNKRHMEEHVPSATKKKRRLRKKYLQCSFDEREDIGKVISNIDEGRSSFLSDELNVVNAAIPLPQKQALVNKSAENDMGGVENEIHKKCEMREKLVEKQKQQIQEVDEVWEDKISKLLEDKRLEAAVIRVIYGKSSATLDKLMILEDKFAKNENKILKYMQLEDLEAGQLAARTKASERAAISLSKTKAHISGKQMSCCNSQSLGAQDEEDLGCSESRKHVLYVNDAVPLTRQHGENNNSCRTVQGMHVVISDNSNCATAGEVGCNASNGNTCDLVHSKENEGGISFPDILIPAVVEQINQPKHFDDGESKCVNLPASGETQSLELQGDIAVEFPESGVNENVDNEPMDFLTNSHVEGFRGADAIDLPDAFPNRRNGTGGITIDDLDSAGQDLETSKQTKDAPHPCPPLLLNVKGKQEQGHVTSSPPKVVVSEFLDSATKLNVETQDQVEPATKIQSSARTDIPTYNITDTVMTEQFSAKLQDQDAPVVKDIFILQKELAESGRVGTEASVANPELIRIQVKTATETQNTSLIEVATTDNMNNPNPVWSRNALQDQSVLIASDSGLADIATPVQSCIDGSAIENCEQLQPISIDESPSCNPLLSIESESRSHNLGRIASGAAPSDKPSHESTCQLREGVEPRSNHVDTGPGIQSSLPCICPSFQSNLALEIEILHRDVLLLGGATNPINVHEVAASSYPSVSANPLHHELEKSLKEIEELQKSHANKVALLKSECAKEIKDVIAEVQNKYKLKVQDAQEQFTLKKDRFNQKQQKVLMNKLLADSFNYNCLKYLPTRPLTQQGSSSYMQHQQHFTRPVGTTVCHPASNLQIPSQNGQVMQPMSAPTLTRPAQFHAAPSPQAQFAAAISSFPARSGAFNVNHPTINPHFGGNIQSSAPHYQVYVPNTRPAFPADVLSTLLRNYHQQQQQPSGSLNPYYLGYPNAL